MKKFFLMFLLVFYFAFNFSTIQAIEKKQTKIPDKYKWDLSHIYKNWDSWGIDYKRVENNVKYPLKFQGKLAQNPKYLINVLDWYYKTLDNILNLIEYPGLLNCTDMSHKIAKENKQKAYILAGKMERNVSWLFPEIQNIPNEKLEKWMVKFPELNIYKFMITELFREKKDQKNEFVEKTLSQLREYISVPQSIFNSMYSIKYPEVKLSNGKVLTLTTQNYSKEMSTNFNEKDRYKMRDAYWNRYLENGNIFAAIYRAACLKNSSLAKIRGYESTLHSSLSKDNIPVEIYHNLISSIKKNNNPIKRFLALEDRLFSFRKKYSSQIKKYNYLPYEKIKEQIISSTGALGNKYQKAVSKIFSSNWIDVYPGKDKQPGAFTARVGVHPYLFINYNDDFNSALALIHEIGHIVHFNFSNQNQPLVNSRPSIFIAEIASTFNERLILESIQKNIDNPIFNVFFLEQMITKIKNNYYGPIIGADFELQIHQAAEKGNPITKESLINTMANIEDAVYGTEHLDELQKKHKGIFWMFFPHYYFNKPFYLYQYATSFVASEYLYDKIFSGSKKDRKIAAKKYINLLKSGGKDKPLNLLLKAGVDMTKQGLYTGVASRLDKLVFELEKALEKVEK